MKMFIVLSLLLCATTAQAKQYPAKLVSCYDGDTCTFTIGLGFGVSTTQTVRFCDIDTPEIKGPDKLRAIKARNYTEQILSKAQSIRLDVQEKKSCSNNRCEKKTFTRILAYVIADGAEVGKHLLAKGHAKIAAKQCK